MIIPRPQNSIYNDARGPCRVMDEGWSKLFFSTSNEMWKEMCDCKKEAKKSTLQHLDNMDPHTCCEKIYIRLCDVICLLSVEINMFHLKISERNFCNLLEKHEKNEATEYPHELKSYQNPNRKPDRFPTTNF